MSFSKTKKETVLRKLIFKNSLLINPQQNRDRVLDKQIDVLNNLNFEEMETKSKISLLYMKQKEL